MGRTLTDATLTTPSARSGLPVGLHWRRLDTDVHLGYRKGKRSGVWLVRWRDGKSYKQVSLGTADDAIKEGNLSFSAAERAARDAVEKARVAARAEIDGDAPTVASAVHHYIAMRNERDSKRAGRPVKSDAATRLGRYVIGMPEVRHKTKPDKVVKPAVPAAPVASIALHELREADLKAWLAGLPDDMLATSKERLATDFKAALNREYEDNYDKLPATVPVAVKRGLKFKADANDEAEISRDNQILTDGQVTALLEAAREVDALGRWEGDLYRLLVVMAGTGMRFSQIARMRVRDVQRENSRLLVPTSRKGQGNKAQPFIAVPVGQDVLDIVQPVVTGRGAGEPLLERWRYGQAPGSIEWIKDRRGPWLSSSEFNRDWQTIKGRAGLPHADPYAFRHSSIVRGIRMGLPIRLIAAQHDTSVVMIEKHYSRYIVDGLADLAAKAVVPLVPALESNVIQIRT